jgi:excisionase family DNA binding protein
MASPKLQDAPMPESPYLTLREAAAYLRVAPVTLYRLVTSGVLPRTKVGGQYRFLTKDLDAVVQEPDATGDAHVSGKPVRTRSKPPASARRDYAAELAAIAAESKARATRGHAYG